jgi:hypothetical protein
LFYQKLFRKEKIMELQAVAVPLAISLTLAFLNESMVEYLFGTVFDKVPSLEPYRWLLMYVAAATGVGMAFYYQLDLISLIQQGVLGLELAPVTPIGMVLTGLGIGRGANYLNDFVSRFQKP